MTRLLLALVLAGCAARSRERLTYAGEYRYEWTTSETEPMWMGQLTLSQSGRWRRYEHVSGICYGTSCLSCCWAEKARARGTSSGRWRVSEHGVVLRRPFGRREPMWAVQHEGATLLLSARQRTELCTSPGDFNWEQVYRKVGEAPQPAPTPAELCSQELQY